MVCACSARTNHPTPRIIEMLPRCFVFHQISPGGDRAALQRLRRLSVRHASRGRLPDSLLAEPNKFDNKLAIPTKSPIIKLRNIAALLLSHICKAGAISNILGRCEMSLLGFAAPISGALERSETQPTGYARDLTSVSSNPSLHSWWDLLSDEVNTQFPNRMKGATA